MKKLNIPTDDGEVRAVDQYVVCAGSYCTTSENDIKAEKLDHQIEEYVLKNPDLGCYTISNLKAPITITYNDLPKFFKDAHEAVKQQEKPQQKTEPIKPTGQHSALFDLTVDNILPISPGRREPHPLHESDTGMNFSKSRALFHCWRHNVSLNPIQYLCVKAKYMTCLEAGTGHKNSGAGASKVTGDDGAIFWAWLQAKKDNLIPIDDKIPVKAMRYIAKKHKVVDDDFDCDFLSDLQINEVLDIVERDY
jgi:putative DNA primase/helicase